MFIKNQFNNIADYINKATNKQGLSMIEGFNEGQSQAADAQNLSNQLLRENAAQKAQQMGLKTEKELLSAGVSLAAKA
jgi:hypothetical protein